MMRKTRYIPLVTLLSLVACVGLAVAEEREEAPVKPTSNPASAPAAVPVRILFFGDSITQMGQEQEDGYVNQLRRAMAGETIEIIGAGIGGHRVMNLEERFDADVLRKNPNIVVIFIGINDIYYAQNHLDWALGRYAEGMDRMIVTMRNRNILPVIVIPSVIGEKKAGDNILDKELDRLGTLATELGKKHKIPVINVLKAFRDHLAEHNPDNAHSGILTRDGIHLNKAGNTLVAVVMEPELRTLLGVNPHPITISISPNDYNNTFFPDTLATITVANARPGTVIRYTTDGTEPTKSSEKYTSPIKLDKTTTVKAVLYVQDKPSGGAGGTFECLKPNIPPADLTGQTLQNGGLNYLAGAAEKPDSPRDEDNFPFTHFIKSTGRTATIGMDPIKDVANPALRFHGYLHIEKEGIYLFRLISDYAGTLSISNHNRHDGGDIPPPNVVIAHNLVSRSPERAIDAVGRFALTPGYYAIEVKYAPKSPPHMLYVDWQPPGEARFVPIPAERLVTVKK